MQPAAHGRTQSPSAWRRRHPTRQRKLLFPESQDGRHKAAAQPISAAPSHLAGWLDRVMHRSASLTQPAMPSTEPWPMAGHGSWTAVFPAAPRRGCCQAPTHSYQSTEPRDSGKCPTLPVVYLREAATASILVAGPLTDHPRCRRRPLHHCPPSLSHPASSLQR
jgi:hypothetical protein